MFAAAVAVTFALAAILLVSARGKLVRDPVQMKTMARVGFPEDRLWLLAAAEMAGAGGMAIGLIWWPIGTAAAAGVVAYFLGATIAHLRVRDWQVTAPAVLFAAAVAALILRTVSS